jgi:dTMP kinase
MNALGPHAPGRLITFEGGEGAGKSTQIRHLAEALEQTGLRVVVTREPGGTPFAERLRALLLDCEAGDRSPLGDALLFAAARIDHVDSVILPALREGAFVLCDRFTDSTHAYQGAMGGADMRLLTLLDRIVLGERRPDLTLILDVPAGEGLARATRRGDRADRFEARELAFHEGLRRAFLDIAKHEPIRCRVIDSTRPKPEVAAEIRQLVSDRFHLPLFHGFAAR